jgi:RsiW-degrading membrane proteinase PrsW (M82 family)
MSYRKLLRIVLSLVVLALLLPRLVRQWRYESAWWLAGSIFLGIALTVLVVYLIATSFRKPRKARDEVPKNPLGLE